tara:strand:+ start:354 stop:914 length:561 start_codon:yes stop_codon:yes gene_type:complete
MAEVGCLKDGCFQNLQVEGNSIMEGPSTAYSPINYLPTTVAYAENANLTLTTTNAPSGSIIICSTTGAATSTLALPEATAGYSLMLVQSITQAGTNTNVISCNGTDTFQLGSFASGGTVAAPAVATIMAAAEDNTITITPAAAAAFDIGSHIYFNCLTDGKWFVRIYQSGKGAGTTAAVAFSSESL